MKKAFFLLFAAAAIVAACTQPVPAEKQYVINGTVEGIEGLDSIALTVPDSANPVLAIVPVIDGKFTFTGKFEKPMPVFVDFKEDAMIADTMDMAEGIILLEDTIFNVTIKAGMFNNSVEGGSLQRIFNEMNKNIKEQAKLMYELNKKADAAETPEAEKVAINHQCDSITMAICKAKVDFVIERMPSEFSNVALPPLATEIMGMCLSNNDYLSEIGRLLNAFAKNQPDAYYYEFIKKGVDKFLKENNLGGIELDEPEENK